jgi:hypothetical protein
MVIKASNGMFYLVRTTALHRRRWRSRRPYSRPTDWLASAGHTTVWGRTKREALAKLFEQFPQ